MDVVRLAKQLGVTQSAVVTRAKELISLATAKAGTLGQAEICKAAVCLELACRAAQCNNELTRETFVKHGCVNVKVYANTFNMLQQVLGVSRKVDLQHLVMQFGCASVRQSVVRVLNLYKERFVARLPETEKAQADFSRPVFLCVAFHLVARKYKIKVEQRALLETMCVPRDDFLEISASMYELCFDVVGVEKNKKKATQRMTRTNVMDNHRQELSDDSDQENCREDAQPSTSKNGTMARAPAAGGGGGVGRPSKRAKRSEEAYDEWKLLVLSGRAGAAKPAPCSAAADDVGGRGGGAAVGGSTGDRRGRDEEKAERGSDGQGGLRQSTLAFAH